jgi:hypothetical protein
LIECRLANSIMMEKQVMPCMPFLKDQTIDHVSSTDA